MRTKELDMGQGVGLRMNQSQRRGDTRYVRSCGMDDLLDALQQGNGSEWCQRDLEGVER